MAAGHDESEAETEASPDRRGSAAVVLSGGRQKTLELRRQICEIGTTTRFPRRLRRIDARRHDSLVEGSQAGA
jgi:hypothetical protein